MPWTHLSHASLSMLHFKVRLCIEGVPLHAHQLEAMVQLFPQEMLLEKLDFQAKNTSEAACCCIWAWVKNPDDVAKSGTLQLEAVSERTEEVWHYNWGNGIAARRMRSALLQHAHPPRLRHRLPADITRGRVAKGPRLLLALRRQGWRARSRPAVRAHEVGPPQARG